VAAAARPPGAHKNNLLTDVIFDNLVEKAAEFGHRADGKRRLSTRGEFTPLGEHE
jgi:hypothetical protein